MGTQWSAQCTTSTLMPRSSPRADAVACTSLDKFGVQNYISAGHAQPSKIGNRRVFTALQMIHMEIVAQLAGLFNIPPSTGNKLAGELVMQMPQGWLALDARTVQQSRAWINSATDHGLVEYRRSDDGNGHQRVGGRIVSPFHFPCASWRARFSLALTQC